MLDTNQELETCEAEIGCPVEQLLTPLTRRCRKRPDAFFAIDNGSFSRFDKAAFLSLLERHSSARKQCRFVAVPDVVAIGQDGEEKVPIPWKEIDAIFIGGSTKWKMGIHAAHVIKAALAVGKWVHVGRVNTPGRFEYFEDLGAHSIDGSGLARYSHMRASIYDAATRPTLFNVEG